MPIKIINRHGIASEFESFNAVLAMFKIIESCDNIEFRYICNAYPKNKILTKNVKFQRNVEIIPDFYAYDEEFYVNHYELLSIRFISLT